MSLDLPAFVLVLFVLFHGIAFGAGIYEQRIVVPRWMGRSPEGAPYLDSEAMRADDPGRRFWGFVSTGPLSIVTLANLYYALANTTPIRQLWLAACAVSLIERLFTFAFFIPKAIQLMRESATPTSTALRTAMMWHALNRVRLTLSLAGWLLALVALGVR